MAPLRALPRATPVPEVAAALAAGVVAVGASLRFGLPGLLLPLALAAAAVLLVRPRAAVVVLITVVVLGESRGSGALPVLANAYEPIVGGVAVVDLLFAVATAAVGLDLLGRGALPRVPARLGVPLALIALAAAAGAVTGYGHGAGLADVAYAGRQLPFLVLMPVLVVSVVHTRADVMRAIGFGAALAVAKAVLGLGAVGAGIGTVVDGSTITYYEPVANWLMLVALLGVLAAVLTGARDRVPGWLLLAVPLMVASLAISLRRSFWIALVLGALLVVVLGLSPGGRRLLVPVVALVIASVWVLGSAGFQAEGPLVARVESLQPSRIEVNAEDRYRIDERANVLAELREHPVTGLGLAVGWSSAARPLPVEHEGGRQYVHATALWYWLKLGLLGLVAYLALVVSVGLMAWRVWRRDEDRLMRACGLAALASLVAISAVETAGSFTGVEQRFTIVFGAFIGLLAVLDLRAQQPLEPSADRPGVVQR